jgi:hypothetical protein
MTKPLDKEGRSQHYEMMRDNLLMNIKRLERVISQLKSTIKLIEWMEENNEGDE